MKRTGIVWFRSDLRLHDNEALHEAIHACDQVIPVYVFEPIFLEKSKRFGMPRMGINRLRFLIESVENLRENIRQRGNELLIRVGPAEDIIFDLAQQFRTSWVFCNRERTRDEVNIQDRLEKKLWSIGQEMRFSRGKMTYYTQDLPFPITQTPDSFATFKKEVENFITVRPPLATPKTIPALAEQTIEAGEIPDPAYLLEGVVMATAQSEIRGGETQGIARLEEFASGSKGIRMYDAWRDGLDDKTSLISAYLSNGSLSPKKVYEAVCTRKDRRFGDDSTRFFNVLMWRDFLRLMGKKHGDKIFQPGGTNGIVRQDLVEDWSSFETWRKGQTGVPVIDACMRKLNSTGFISNRARKLVSSYLINDLSVSWLMGAEYFESVLIDYDPCSNYGNWNYAAGVDSDTYSEVVLNIGSQAKKLDPDASFTRKWAKEYRSFSSNQIQQLYDRAEMAI
ncbi:MAG: DASH family cryptochrome [Saprospiraceae bacterium]|nr:DASH family cryptochrome [Saprospiraceae bacterium]